MSTKTAAIEVLQQAKKTLHVREITEKIVAQNLWQSQGLAHVTINLKPKPPPC